MNKTIITIVMAVICLNLSAQTDVDALRLNPFYLGSTAKSMGTAGSSAILGADPSVTSINPAGLGQYRSSEFTISTSMNYGSNESTYLGTTTRDNFFNTELNNIGLVFSNVKTRKGVPVKKGIVNSSVGITLNRTDNYNAVIHYKGDNTNISFLDFVAASSNGLSANYLGTAETSLDGYQDFRQMFWDAVLIDSFNNGSYYPVIEDGNVNVNQKNVIRREGGANEFNFSYGANYEHKLYFGFGLNIAFNRFEETNEYSELDNSAELGPTNFTPWDEFNYTSTYKNRAQAVGGNFGLIYRINDNIRIGGAIHTPKVYSVNESYDFSLNAFYDDGTESSYETGRTDFNIEYKVTTPMKLNGSIAYLFGKKGFLSAEIESVDYSTMRMTSDVTSFEDINDLIRSKYDNAINFKVGGEAVKDQFRFRLGYASFGSPLIEDKANNNQQAITAGIGINDKFWSMDLGMVRRLSNSQTQPYEVNGFNVPLAQNNSNTTQLVLTFARKF